MKEMEEMFVAGALYNITFSWSGYMEISFATWGRYGQEVHRQTKHTVTHMAHVHKSILHSHDNKTFKITSSVTDMKRLTVSTSEHAFVVGCMNGVCHRLTADQKKKNGPATPTSKEGTSPLHHSSFNLMNYCLNVVTDLESL